MDNNSWIKIFRKFKEWGWYKNSNVKDLFLEILLTANYEDKPWQKIIIKRGQLATSIIHLSEETGLTVRQVRTALDNLKLTNELTIETTTKYTLITINKYNDYQQISNELTNQRQTNDKPMTTTKEYKELKNIKNKYIKPNLSDKDFEEIANKYNIRLKDVLDKNDGMILWYEQDPLKHKKINWKATLMNWIREDIRSRKIQKIVKMEIPLITMTEDERKKSLIMLDKIKKEGIKKIGA